MNKYLLRIKISSYFSTEEKNCHYRKFPLNCLGNDRTTKYITDKQFTPSFLICSAIAQLLSFTCATYAAKPANIVNITMRRSQHRLTCLRRKNRAKANFLVVCGG